MFWRKFIGSTLLLAGSLALAAGSQARTVEVKILSTMLADDDGFGEWGFSALVTVDGYPILFDTGAHPDTVLNNLRALKVDLSRTTDVILSHNHLDHTAGLITLREAYMKSGGVIRAHVGKGIFTPRVRKDGTVTNAMIAVQDAIRIGRRDVRRLRQSTRDPAGRLADRPGAAHVSGAELDRRAQLTRRRWQA